MHKAQRPTSGVAKHFKSHQIPHHAMCDLVVLNMWSDVRCGMVCCAGNVVRCEILLSGSRWDVECITHCHCISHLIASHYGHHILYCIISHQTPSLALFQTTPHSTSHHHSSPSHTFHIAPAPLAEHYSTLQYHISNHTISATLCITPLASRIAPHYTLQTYHIRLHATSVSDHTIYWAPVEPASRAGGV